ncbi:MAG TPA: hypothetical protein VJY42_02385 [Candidatus Methanomethylophilaceae archaeon]|nr:hypothetical protein [Candidatus Methanomethylophilaceae archaeon]
MTETDSKPKTVKKTDKKASETKETMKILNIRYCAYFTEGMTLYDTTEEDEAKKAEMYDEKFTYAPMVFITGSNMLFPRA